MNDYGIYSSEMLSEFSDYMISYNEPFKHIESDPLEPVQQIKEHKL